MPRDLDATTTQDLCDALDELVDDESSAADQLAALQITAISMLVEAVDRLTEQAAKSAEAIDWISDHLNEVGQPA